MRILHMIPDIGISNGIVSVVLNYAKAMPEDIKFDVVYFFESKENRQKEIEALGGRVFKINPPSPKTALKGEMRKFFAEHKDEWDVLHINAPHFAIFIAPAARRAGIKKICMHCHSTVYSLKPENIKRNELFYKLGRDYADKKFACSKAAGEYWYGKDFTVIKNAVDSQKLKYNCEAEKQVRSQLGVGDELLVGHVGRTDISQKNHPFLLEVFSEIKKIAPSAKLLLIGGSQSDKTTDICNELNIADDVFFLGARNDVHKLLQAIDVFVFPSIKEGLPMAVIEAQAAGVPVVMSDTITDEVIVSPETVAMSLEVSATEWADKALEMTAANKRDNSNLIKSSGWDIYDCAKTLTDYYRG